MAGSTREQNSADSKERTSGKRRTDLEDWRVDGLPGESPSARRRASAAPAPPAHASPRRRSSRGSEWLPASGRRRNRPDSSNGNGRAGVEELEGRAAELERELRKERRRSRAEIAKLRSRLREQEAPVSSSGRLDANSASFEQLRGLGLTPAQSAKLITRRESAGGFKAKAELRRIPGLSKSARELIEKRLSVRR